MPSPFPGMDPYLERPALWPGVHFDLIGAVRDALQPLVRPRYYVSVELRTYSVGPEEFPLLGIPDAAVIGEHAPWPATNGPPGSDGGELSRSGAPQRAASRVLTVELPKTAEVRERYLEVREAGTDEVVTVIEVLSPTNKGYGRGRRKYERKRDKIASTLTNLVEIDLLRTGRPLPVRYVDGPQPARPAREGTYRVLVSRGYRDHRAELHAIGLRDPLPTVTVPLRPDDQEPPLDLQAVLRVVYERGVYEVRLNYQRDPVPPLDAEDAAWADALLRQAGLR